MAGTERTRQKGPGATQPATVGRSAVPDAGRRGDATERLRLLQQGLGNQAVQRMLAAPPRPEPAVRARADETGLDLVEDEEAVQRAESTARRRDLMGATARPPRPPTVEATAGPAAVLARVPVRGPDAGPAPVRPVASTPSAATGRSVSPAPSTATTDRPVTSTPATVAQPAHGRSPDAATSRARTPGAGASPAPPTPTADSPSRQPAPSAPARAPSTAQPAPQPAAAKAADRDPASRPPDRPPPSASQDRPALGRLVDDERARPPEKGQMRKGEFLAALRVNMLDTAEQSLAGTGHSAQDCPWIEYWFEYYGRQGAQRVERAIHRYAPETLGVAVAGDYIPHVTERVRRAISTWARTGQITGVPDGVPVDLPGRAELAQSQRARRGLRFKRRDGGARIEGAPREIRARLGAGRPLEGRTRGRMEAAFGTDFSDVRIHTDGQASALAGRFDAHAFAVGEHVAFGAGEYQPGTLVGDALLAHELAHVVQQRGADAEAAEPPRAETGAIEHDADTAAVGAVTSLWLAGRRALGGVASQAMPRLRSGISLSRCGGGSKFPSYSRIVGDADVTTKVDAAWASTEAAANATSRREEGFWIRLNEGTGRYEFTSTVVGPSVGPTVGASVVLGARPADTSGTDGTTYTVASFHTHTPTAFRPVARAVGPSGADESADTSDDVVGVVYDYVESPAGSGNIPAGHPIGSAAQTYHSGPDRRQNE
jgi:hypothetical protein